MGIKHIFEKSNAGNTKKRKTNNDPKLLHNETTCVQQTTPKTPRKRQLKRLNFLRCVTHFWCKTEARNDTRKSIQTILDPHLVTLKTVLVQAPFFDVVCLFCGFSDLGNRTKRCQSYDNEGSTFPPPTIFRKHTKHEFLWDPRKLMENVKSLNENTSDKTKRKPKKHT